MVYLVVDSTCCVSEQYVKDNNIKVIDLKVTLDGVTRTEGFEDTWGSFFSALKNTKSFPQTSQPSPVEFEEIYKSIFEKDKLAEIVVVTLSSSLSGTVNSARLAAQSVNPERIFIVDSGQTCQSELLLIEEVVEMIKQGKTGKEIEQVANDLKTKICIQFVPSTMEYLKRGGRISLLSATFASVLNIKPILCFKNGVLTCAKKVLGMGKALSEMIANVPKTVKKIYVCYINESEYLQKLIDKVNATFHTNIVEGKNIGPIVGSHIGMGAVGLATIDA